MGDTASFYGNASELAAGVEYLLEARGLSPTRLDEPIVKQYDDRFFIGWRIALPTALGIRQADVLLPLGYPFARPRIGVKALAAEHVPHAHVESSRLLCLHESSTTPTISLDAAVLIEELDRAADLLAQSVDQLKEDRASEFVRYWEMDATGAPIYSILDPDTPYGLVKACSSRHFTLVSANAEDARVWLTRRFSSDDEDWPFEDALYLYGEGLHDNLSGGSDLTALAQRNPATLEALKKVAAQWPTDAVTLFRLPGEFVLVGGRLGAPHEDNHVARATPHRGFRKGRMPPTVTANRFLPRSRFHKAPLQRADAQWLLARGGDSYVPQLKNAHVCLLGAGALGSGIARLLAKAGVGRLTIIDPEVLRFENIARHDLGADDVDQPKATALATKIMRQYPFVDVRGISDRWQAATAGNASLFDVNAIVSTTASWGDEAELNALLRETRARSPVIYGWLEAHAAAAHALTVSSNGACIACVFSASGHFLHRVTEWPESQLKLEPACGSSYAPFSDLAATRARCLIAQTTISVLLTPDKIPTSLTTELYDEELWQKNGGTLVEASINNLGRPISGTVDRWTTHIQANPACPWHTN